MRLPAECGDDAGGIIQLNKSLNGLKQASRTWNNMMVKDLEDCGFEQCAASVRACARVTAGVTAGTRVSSASVAPAAVCSSSALSLGEEPLPPVEGETACFPFLAPCPMNSPCILRAPL